MSKASGDKHCPSSHPKSTLAGPLRHSSPLLHFGEHPSACSSFYPAYFFLPRKLPPLCIYIPARWSLSWGPLWLINHFNYRDFCKHVQNSAASNILGEFNVKLKRSMQVAVHGINTVYGYLLLLLEKYYLPKTKILNLEIYPKKPMIILSVYA